MASREQVARLLKVMGDPLAQRLLDLGTSGIVRPSARTLSVLIHGFRAAPVDDPRPLDGLYRTLKELIVQDTGSEADVYLKNAQALDFSDKEEVDGHTLRHPTGGHSP